MPSPVRERTGPVPVYDPMRNHGGRLKIPLNEMAVWDEIVVCDEDGAPEVYDKGLASRVGMRIHRFERRYAGHRFEQRRHGDHIRIRRVA